MQEDVKVEETEEEGQEIELETKEETTDEVTVETKDVSRSGCDVHHARYG